MSEDRLLPVKAVAERYGVCDQTVRNWVRSGKLAGKLIGSRYYVAEGALAAFEAAGEVAPPPGPPPGPRELSAAERASLERLREAGML